MSVNYKEIEHAKHDEHKPSTNSPNHDGFYENLGVRLQPYGCIVYYGNNTLPIEVGDGYWNIDGVIVHEPTGIIVGIGEALSCTVESMKGPKNNREEDPQKNPTYSTGNNDVRIKMGYFFQHKIWMDDNTDVINPVKFFNYSFKSNVDVTATEEEAKRLKKDEERKNIVSAETIVSKVKGWIKWNSFEQLGIDKKGISCNLYGDSNKAFPKGDNYKYKIYNLAGSSSEEQIEYIVKEVQKRIEEIEKLGDKAKSIPNPLLGQIYKGYVDENGVRIHDKLNSDDKKNKSWEDHIKKRYKDDLKLILNERELNYHGVIRDIECLALRFVVEDFDAFFEKIMEKEKEGSLDGSI